MRADVTGTGLFYQLHALFWGLADDFNLIRIYLETSAKTSKTIVTGKNLELRELDEQRSRLEACNWK